MNILEKIDAWEMRLWARFPKPAPAPVRGEGYPWGAALVGIAFWTLVVCVLIRLA